MQFPRFTKTAEDVGQEIREKKSELTKVLNELEKATRESKERSAWLVAREKESNEKLEDAKEKVEGLEGDRALLEKEVLSLSGKIVKGTRKLKEFKEKRIQLEDSIDALEENYLDLKKGIKTEVERAAEAIVETQKDLDEMIEIKRGAKAEVENLKTEFVELQKVQNRREEELDARDIYLKKVSELQRQKGRDLRLWEVRVKRKVEKHLNIKLN